MRPSERDFLSSARPIVLRTDEVAATILAGKGADVYSLVDLRSGVDVLFKTPWGLRDPGLLPTFADSKLDWLARYPGGWQLLVPNAGDAREQDGAQLGFHGEAAIVPWQVHEHDATSAVLRTRLITAPLHLERVIRVDRSTLVVRDEIHNESPDEVRVAWSEHIALGVPFLGAGSRLRTDATRFVSDAVAPGTILPPGVSSPIDAVVDLAGAPVDLGVLPAPGERRELFGTLAGFDLGRCVVTSPRLGLAVEVRWPVDTLPYAWLWQEMSASRGFPWYRRVHALGVEPSNVPTTDDPVTGSRRTDPPVLGGGRSAVAELTVSLMSFDAARAQRAPA